MTHQVAYLNVFLAVLRELRPVTRNWSVQIEVTTIDEHQQRKTSYRLCRGKHINNRVFGPRDRSFLVPPASPEVDHHLALDVHVERGTDFLTGTDIRGERITNALETRIP